MTDHICGEKETLGNHGARIKNLEDEKQNDKGKFKEIFRRIGSIEKGPGDQANKEISAVKIGIIIAIATAAAQLGMEVVAWAFKGV
jgi:hypothetical protein